MLRHLERLTNPTTEPVTVAEAKACLHVEHADDDAFIGHLISAARETAENLTGQALAAATWRATYDGFADLIVLPRPPLVAVSSVAYRDMAGSWQAIAGSNYVVVPGPVASLRPLTGDDWPETDDEAGALKVEFSAGPTVASSAVKHAILLAVQHWYEARGPGQTLVGVDLPPAFSTLLFGSLGGYATIAWGK